MLGLLELKYTGATKMKKDKSKIKLDDAKAVSQLTRKCYTAYNLLGNNKEAIFTLEKNLKSLDSESEFLMRLYFNYPPQLTIDEISELLDITRERVIEKINQNSDKLLDPIKFHSLEPIFNEAVNEYQKKLDNLKDAFFPKDN